MKTLLENPFMPEKTTEHIELVVSKEKLQFMMWFIGILLSIISFFSYKSLSGIDTLKENSADFKTYIQTNDQRVLHLERSFQDHLQQDRIHQERTKELEEKEIQFWKDYGWLFIEAQRRKQ